jgi:thiamine biosynthesis lipoprotein
MLTLAWWGLVGCAPEQERAAFTFETMGTVARCDLELPEGLSTGQAQALVEATYQEVNAVFSTWSPDSELSHLNRAPADSAVSLSPWLGQCLREAERLREISRGAFDPTAEPLMRLWGFYRRQGRLPAAAALDSARALMGGYVLGPEGTVTKHAAGTHFDLGGIAKGFAVDQAMARLQQAGVKNGLVDLGGNLFCLGGAAGRTDWRVGVRDPLNRDRYFGTVSVTDLALATSGSYERFVTIDGRRYGHIMNPATGHPAEGVLGVTVLAPSAQLADGLSTALFVAGEEAGREILSRLETPVEVIMVLPGPTEDTAEVLLTPGLEGRVSLLPDYAERFTLRSW